jgi:hypothetical protein
VIIGRAYTRQENPQEEDDGRCIVMKASQPRGTDREKRNIRNDVPKVRDAEYRALVGELVIALILRDRGQQQQPAE